MTLVTQQEFLVDIPTEMPIMDSTHTNTAGRHRMLTKYTNYVVVTKGQPEDQYLRLTWEEARALRQQDGTRIYAAKDCEKHVQRTYNSTRLRSWEYSCALSSGDPAKIAKAEKALARAEALWDKWCERERLVGPWSPVPQRPEPVEA